MVLKEKNILVPEGSFSANTVLFMYITSKQSPGHMPVAQPGTWVGEKRSFWQLWIWLESRQSWVGSMQTRAKRDREECRDMGELATHSSWSQPPSAGGKVAEMDPRKWQLQELFRKKKE